ncbi:hypothetical protein ARSEF1564_005235 [Beauveria bassiana]
MRFVHLPRRCGLCRFVLKDGERIVVVHREGQISKKHVFASTEFIDDESGTWYKPSKDARAELDSADAVHQSCFDETAPDTPDLHASIRNAVTTYSCEPPVSEDRRRAYWHRKCFVTTLSTLFRHTTLSPIPELLLHMIAAYCVQNRAAQFTVLIGLKSTESHPEERTGTIDASKDIWMTQTCFEGYKYVKSLANEEPMCGILLREKNADEAAATIYVAEDHLGVRKILFGESGKLAAEERPGVWWRTIRGDASILWESDVRADYLRNIMMLIRY